MQGKKMSAADLPKDILNKPFDEYDMVQFKGDPFILVKSDDNIILIKIFDLTDKIHMSRKDYFEKVSKGEINLIPNYNLNMNCNFTIIQIAK